MRGHLHDARGGGRCGGGGGVEAAGWCAEGGAQGGGEALHRACAKCSVVGGGCSVGAVVRTRMSFARCVCGTESVEDSIE